MLRLGLPSLLSTCAIAGAFWTWSIGEEDRAAAAARLADLERLAIQRAEIHACEERALRDELARVETELESAVRDELGGRIGLTEATLERMRDELENREVRLAELEVLQARVESSDLEQRLAALDGRIETRLAELDLAATEARSLADDGRETAERLALDLERLRTIAESDPEHLWGSLMGPVVQITGGSSVGSGVLLAPTERPDGTSRTLILTAWHVVRDLDHSIPNLRVPVRVYDADGNIANYRAAILEHNAPLDTALLELDGDEALPHGALLAAGDRVADARTFEPIWAVGCPLGTDPIPTYGQIASPDHSVDGERYWMINAATYIGNSGGGIFDAKSFELLGVFSKIYNHGSSRPTIVPHMGLVTPLDAIYPWLESVGYTRDEHGRLLERANYAMRDLDVRRVLAAVGEED